jgi:ketosteroid isomerase-like protein
LHAASDDQDASPTLSRDATAAAFERHRVAHDQSDAAWESIVDLFAEDATYFDAFYGEFKGRDAIRAFLRRVMAGLEDWRFPVVWHVVGEGRVVVHLQNRLPGRRPGGTFYEFPSVSLITYGADGLITRQVDLYDTMAAVRTLVEAKTGPVGRAATALFDWSRTALPELLRQVQRLTRLPLS